MNARVCTKSRIHTGAGVPWQRSKSGIPSKKCSFSQKGLAVVGSYVDEPLALITPTAKYYYHANHLYSVAALTDQAGAVVERYRYDTYGSRTILAPDGVTPRAVSSYNQQVGFTGRYLDKETGLWFFRSRYYSANLGRFINRQPWVYLEADIISNYAIEAMDEAWAQIFLEREEDDVGTSYIQGRLNLYDYAHGDPANMLEPYSRAALARLIGRGIKGVWDWIWNKPKPPATVPRPVTPPATTPKPTAPKPTTPEPPKPDAPKPKLTPDCKALKAAVGIACKTVSMNCNDCDKEQAIINIGLLEACKAARVAFTAKCAPGGVDDPGHAKTIEDLEKAIIKCKAVAGVP